MRKLDSSNILFLVCLGFILVVMLGLILQSCRSVRLDSSTKTSSQSVTQDKHSIVDENISLTGLIQQWDENMHIIVRDFDIRYDSCGRSESVLQRETELMHNRTYHRDSTSVDKEKKSFQNSLYNKVNDDKIETELVEKQLPFSISPWWFLLILIILFLCKFHKHFF